jgi:hypothetical protein
MRLIRSLSAPLLLLLTGCPQESYIWVEPGSRATNLVFRFSDRKGGSDSAMVGSLIVERCDRPGDWSPRLMWGAAPVAADYTPPVRVTYGVMPAGYGPLMKQPDSVPRLTPGCYFAGVSGMGQVTFDVTASGLVLERDSRPE